MSNSNNDLISTLVMADRHSWTSGLEKYYMKQTISQSEMTHTCSRLEVELFKLLVGEDGEVEESPVISLL